MDIEQRRKPERRNRRPEFWQALPHAITRQTISASKRLEAPSLLKPLKVLLVNKRELLSPKNDS